MYLLDKLKEMKVRFDESDELSSSDKSFIESNYERILSKRFNNRGCGQCYRDAFIEMYLYATKNGIKDMGKFIMKREVVRTIDGTVYSRTNITDEAAIKLLKSYPQRIDDFESYPDNWEELIVIKTKEPKANGESKKKSKEPKVNSDSEKIPTDNGTQPDNIEDVKE